MSSDTPLNYHVFLSHSSQDRKWAEAACKVLEKRGMRCWIAPRDITPGTEWAEAIIDGIDRSRLMVLIFSTNANESPQVRREVERAIGKSLPVLPLRIEDVQPKGAMEFALSNTHWLDAFKPPASDRLGQLADSVETLLGVTKVESETPAPKRGLRRAWLVAIVGLIGIIASIAIYFRNPADSGDEEVTDENTAPPGKFVVDETSNFVGVWLAIEESGPGGAFPAERVKARNLTLFMGNHEVRLRRNSKPKVTETLNGSVDFQVVDGKNCFSLAARSSDGNRLLWKGTYVFKDDQLMICYRAATGNHDKPMRKRDIPLAPERIFERGERDTYYLKLEKQGMRKRSPS